MVAYHVAIFEFNYIGRLHPVHWLQPYIPGTLYILFSTVLS